MNDPLSRLRRPVSRKPLTPDAERRPPERPSTQTAFPSTSFWNEGEADADTLLTGHRDTEALAHREALRTLDQQLETLRATALPKPNPVFRYVLYFLLFTILLSVRDLRVLFREPGTLLSLHRLYQSDASDAVLPEVQAELRQSADDLAAEYDLSVDEIRTAQEVLFRIAEEAKLKHIRLLDWGIVFQVGEIAFVFGYNIFLNMLYAAGLGAVLFLRNRERTQSRLIDRQNRELSILNERQSLEVRETSRLLRILSRAQSRLLAAEKLASIGRLSATLAHEIRNPLGIISSSVGMVAEDIEPSSPSGQALELIRHEIDRLNKIISDLLDFARPQVPTPNYFDVNDLVRDWTGPLEEELGAKHIRILAELDPAPPEVYVDADKLYQAFLNLMINAAEALDDADGGDITVTTRTESRDIVVLEIRDNANGIPPDILKQVFEPFFTTKTTGSGLGLAVVKQIVESMGGTVEIQSRTGKGTAVRLRLPTGPSSVLNLALPEPAHDPSVPDDADYTI